MALVETLVILAGLVLIALGLADIFLTILHPDRDGPVSVAINRGLWLSAVHLSRLVPRAAREIVPIAGGLMIAATITTWMVLLVLGFALVAWPHLASGFALPEPTATSFLDALYWSGVTFTTLGYGDIRPVAPLWKAVALAEAMAGFALVGGAVAFLLSVFQGVDHRDSMSLRVFSETRRTWDGTGFVTRVLMSEGTPGVQQHLEAWAQEVRDLHERLYRFQPLAFYVRTRSEKHEPERMLEALGQIAVAGAVLGRAPEKAAVRAAADELDIAFTEFAISTIRHHGSQRALRQLLEPEPTAEDRAELARVRVRIEDALDAPPAARARPLEDDAQVLELVARVRVFLDEVDRITRWRSIPRRRPQGVR